MTEIAAFAIGFRVPVMGQLKLGVLVVVGEMIGDAAYWAKQRGCHTVLGAASVVPLVAAAAPPDLPRERPAGQLEVVHTFDKDMPTGVTVSHKGRIFVESTQGKGSTFEGGFRVPAIVRWPGKIKAGSISNEIVQHHDWLPTLLAAAGEPDVMDGPLVKVVRVGA